ncbi:hypothetical protein GUITHDRAFT_122692 [Guillardia theta CCMP2712]|uniref:Uncharacterized protein n=1 Tax=Guillardia theta (strain CCMP2712) TaxID=905079 RepID=L1I5H1_GUITC|nr:hypothetical protein GUITHDRAFT_122692 [Guillardia theta CCMP2712]EKX31105.1 hypothetical protein GUITHDRAFT_122692 [Guillardia theta CCMP2712]|eukprot:XP_005818085.1 hypothetical protein GUITHDRAFT_122692 [Guillardia theta CCMP2712]
MPHFASALEGRLPAGAAGIRLKSIQGLLSLLLLVFVLSAHALPAPARRSILRPMGAIDARHAGMQRQCRLTCLRGGQDAQGEETEGEVNRESKDGSAEEEDGSSPGSAGADASKEDGEQEAENEQEGAGQTPAPFVHRAAFGIPVPNELAASVVNLLISVGCILLTAVLRAGYLYRGQQPPNPGAMQVTMNVLMGMSSVQLLFIVHRLLVQAAPTIKNVYRDVFQPGEPPKTKEEAMAKRRRQRVALRVMRTISTIMFMALYRARGRMSKSDGGGGGGGGAQAAATVASLASTFSSLKSSARWMWMSALESIFTLLGDELALLGLYVAEGRELTDEQKARVAQLVKEQEEREAAENGENLGDGKEEEEGGEEEKEGSGEQREGMELRKPGLEGLLSGIGSFFARRKEEAAAVASPPLREEEEEVREKVRSDSCPVDSRGEEVAAPGLRGSEERAEVQAEEEEEEVNAGPDLSLRKERRRRRSKV